MIAIWILINPEGKILLFKSVNTIFCKILYLVIPVIISAFLYLTHLAVDLLKNVKEPFQNWVLSYRTGVFSPKTRSYSPDRFCKSLIINYRVLTK